MIGNDIIDLKLAKTESNWKRPRFLRKVFTEKERELITKSENKNQMVWLLWSMKEAAYKVYVQQLKKPFFNPKNLVCKLTSKCNGLVLIEDMVYFTNSSLSENCIYTIATLNHRKRYKTHCFEVKETLYHFQHEESYQAVLKMFSELNKVPMDAMEIKKNRLGIPKLFQNNKEQRISFSLTHHGNYCGWAISN